MDTTPCRRVETDVSEEHGTSVFKAKNKAIEQHQEGWQDADGHLPDYTSLHKIIFTVNAVTV